MYFKELRSFSNHLTYILCYDHHRKVHKLILILNMNGLVEFLLLNGALDFLLL